MSLRNGRGYRPRLRRNTISVSNFGDSLAEAYCLSVCYHRGRGHLRSPTNQRLRPRAGKLNPVIASSSSSVTSDSQFADSEGILPRQEIAEMVKRGLICSAFTILPRQLQPASLDLRLGEVAIRVQCSFLPGKEPVKDKLTKYASHTLDLVRGAVLEPGAVYIIPLMEEVRLPKGLRAKANPRSSTGRLDIFTRVISDRSDRFDEISDGYQGPLFLEVVTRSFPVRVERYLSLSQIRFVRGTSRCSTDEIMTIYDEQGPLLYEGETPVAREEIIRRGGLFLQVDLSGIGGTHCVGYKAKKNSQLIDLSRLDHYAVFDYWEPVFRDSRGQLILERDHFYLLTSKDKVRIPASCAAEMVAYEETSGELRTHYAGFFDPGFGYGRQGEIKGTVAVMEVRALDAPFMVEDGQRFCRLHLERMAVPPDQVYGSRDIGSSYQFQGLTPSKHFRMPRPDEIKKRAFDPQQLLFEMDPGRG
ncbi:MAG: 2'-deoxycytidine 5'-triphosphate deaminase [Candidatus Rokubacteria bacterium]|nr:2'-deoxycytidine 5'-triphosphate deaminase [Candidatus Rokubacteria bacterium]